MSSAKTILCLAAALAVALFFVPSIADAGNCHAQAVVVQPQAIAVQPVVTQVVPSVVVQPLAVQAVAVQPLAVQQVCVGRRCNIRQQAIVQNPAALQVNVTPRRSLLRPFRPAARVRVRVR